MLLLLLLLPLLLFGLGRGWLFVWNYSLCLFLCYVRSSISARILGQLGSRFVLNPKQHQCPCRGKPHPGLYCQHDKMSFSDLQNHRNFSASYPGDLILFFKTLYNEKFQIYTSVKRNVVRNPSSHHPA